MLKRLLLTVSLLLASTAAAFAAPLTLPTDPHADLDAQMRYLQDPSKALTVEQVRQTPSAGWRTVNEAAFNRGLSDSAWWFKLEIANPHQAPRKRLLEIAYAILDHVDIHVFDGARKLSVFHLGDKRPYAERPFDHHHFVVPLEWEAAQTLTLFIRIETEGALWAPFNLWEREAFISYDGERNAAQGMLFGALGIFVAYNLLLFLAVRERSYLFYVLTYGCIFLFSTTYAGLSFRYLWPESTAWNNVAIAVFLAGTSTFGSLLSDSLLRLKTIHPRLSAALRLVALLSALVACSAAVLPYQTALTIALACGFVSLGLSFVVALYAVPESGFAARFYATGLAVALLGGLPGTLAAAQVLPLTVVTGQATYAGAVLGALFLSFALTARATDDRRLRYQAEKEALRTTQQANARLEERVAERTQEQQRLHVQLEELTSTDALTGAKNRRFLEQRLRDEWIRCQQHGRKLAVVLFDADHFKTVNDTYGHPAGDACLHAIAERTQPCLNRPADQFARFGGEEFCLLLPETDEHGAGIVAERVRAAIAASPIDYEDQAIPVTVSAGVAATVPTPDDRPDALLNRADKALYEAKEAGRNTVRVFQPADDHQPDGGRRPR